MRKFIGRRVRVETTGDSSEPTVVIHQGQRWEIAEIERTWFDTGHGATPVSAQSWRTRRHRKHFQVRTTDGRRLNLYLDYARSDEAVWQLVTVEEPDA
jgi:hypothetical protein